MRRSEARATLTGHLGVWRPSPRPGRSRDQQAEVTNAYIETRVVVPELPEELFYFTHYGLFRYPSPASRSTMETPLSPLAVQRRPVCPVVGAC